MSETFRCDDKDMLVAYLYGEIDDDGRREVERHLRTCPACATETGGLQAVRQDLASWLPPEPDLGFTIVQKPMLKPAPVLTSPRWSTVGALPLWARVAAAVLIVGIGVGIANLHVQYGSNGLVVTTGWMSPAGAPAPVAETLADEWRPALVALEKNLRSEFARQQQAEAPALVAASTPPDAAPLMRRVQALLDASEERQRQEMAVRLLQAQRDWNTQRQADLRNISQTFGSLQGRTIQMEAGQAQMLNYVRRVNTQPIP